MPDLESLIRTYGYGALFVGTFLEGETVLILAGLIAHMGMMKLPLVMGVAFLGSFLGDQIFFFLGRIKGAALLDSHPSWKNRAEKVHGAMRRYRNGIMLGFRFVYGMRMITPLILGMDRTIPARWFILLNLIGAAIWSVVVALVGYSLGRAAGTMLKDIRHYEWALLIGIILVAVAIRLLAARREKRKSS